MTGIGTNAGAASGDTVGADDATLTAIVGEGGSDSTFDGSGNLVVNGEFGTLTIDAQGNYTYVPFANAAGGTEDVFTYTLTDGDGDVITATLTIINPDQAPTAGPNPVVQLDDDVLGGNPGGIGDDAEFGQCHGHAERRWRRRRADLRPVDHRRARRLHLCRWPQRLDPGPAGPGRRAGHGADDHRQCGHRRLYGGPEREHPAPRRAGREQCRLHHQLQR